MIGLNLTLSILDVLENVNPYASDSEFDNDPVQDAPTPDVDGEGEEQGGEAQDLGDEEEAEVEEDAEGNFEDIAAEIGRAMEEDSSEDDDEDDEDESASEEDEDEDEEAAQARMLLTEEIRDLEGAVERKKAEIAGAFNPLIKVCPAPPVSSWASISILKSQIETIRRCTQEAQGRPRESYFPAGATRTAQAC